MACDLSFVVKGDRQAVMFTENVVISR